jgi:hypothetical protein
LGDFLHEVFKINLLNEGAKERSLFLISIPRNAFGQEVSGVLQGEWLHACTAVSDQGPLISRCVITTSMEFETLGLDVNLHVVDAGYLKDQIILRTDFLVDHELTVDFANQRLSGTWWNSNM